MIDWSKSYSATWRVFSVNRKTWADGQLIDNVDSIDVSRTADGSLIESGSLSVTGDFSPDYYRIVMTAEQGGEVERVNVATLLFDMSDGEFNHNVTTNHVDGFSVLYPASVSAITIGKYAPANSDGAQYVKELLEEAINAPVEVEGSFTLNDNIVFELGATVLDCAWLVLDAGKFVLQIDGYGTVHVKPTPTEPDLILNANTKGVLMNGVSFEANMSEIPNRYVVIDENFVTTAVNDDPDSIVSTVSRGYNVDVIDTSPALVNSETYGQYARRKLEESSVLKEEKSYSREYAPDVYPYSIIRASLNGLDGDIRVQSQTISCDHGIKVSERSIKEHKLWQR